MRALAVLLLLTAAACGRICPRTEPLTSTDGGAQPCVQNTDCPRPSSVLVCGSAEDQLRDCIGCTNNVCIHYVREACP